MRSGTGISGGGTLSYTDPSHARCKVSGGPLNGQCDNATVCGPGSRRESVGGVWKCKKPDRQEVRTTTWNPQADCRQKAGPAPVVRVDNVARATITPELYQGKEVYLFVKGANVGLHSNRIDADRDLHQSALQGVPDCARPDCLRLRLHAEATAPTTMRTIKIRESHGSEASFTIEVKTPPVEGNVVAAPGATAAAGIRLATQLLDYGKARGAGAWFQNNLDGVIAPCQIHQQDWSQVTGVQGVGVRFTADCGSSPRPASGNPEAFANFKLKNGWKVKSVETMPRPYSHGNASWSWETDPQTRVGTDDPRLKMRMSANPGGLVVVDVKVTIEGPADKDPYR